MENKTSDLKGIIAQNIGQGQKRIGMLKSEITKMEEEQNIQNYLGLQAALEQEEKYLANLRKDYSNICTHIFAMYKSDNKNKMACLDCGIDAIAVEGKRKPGNRWIVIPHRFDSLEEAKEIYKQAVINTGTNEVSIVKEEMIKILQPQRPILKENKRKKLILPVAKKQII